MSTRVPEPPPKTVASSLMSATMNAPTTGPYRVPRPPTSADSTIITLPRIANAPSGLRNVRKYAYTPPATPMKNALAAYARTLNRVVFTPIAAALPSSSRIAISPVPNLVRLIQALNSTVSTRMSRNA